MHRISVSSSNIATVGYDPRSETLEIEFHSGGIYQYDGVSITAYQNLMNSESKGRHFATHIKYVYRVRSMT